MTTKLVLHVLHIFRKLAKKQYTTIEEIIKGCPTLKHRLIKSKDQQRKRETERQKRELEEKKKAEDPTRQLLELMKAQAAKAQTNETIAKIGKVDALLNAHPQFDQAQQRAMGISPFNYRDEQGQNRQTAKDYSGTAQERARAHARGEGPAWDRIIYGEEAAKTIPPVDPNVVAALAKHDVEGGSNSRPEPHVRRSVFFSEHSLLP